MNSEDPILVYAIKQLRLKARMIRVRRKFRQIFLNKNPHDIAHLARKLKAANDTSLNQHTKTVMEIQRSKLLQID